MILQSQINATTTLAALRDLLNSWTPDSEGEGERLEDVCDLPGLPTFGGESPVDTREIWSWDSENIMTYVNGQYVVCSR